MTQNHDHDFQQFRGAFDSAMIPDADFKARMENLLQREKPSEKSQRTSTVLASPAKKTSETVIPTRRSHPLMIAVAVLMVFSVVIASVWVLSGDMLEGEYASAPSGIATMPADAPGTPGADVHLNAEKVDDIEGPSRLHGVYNGVVVIQHWVEYSDEQVIDAESGDGPGAPSRVHVPVIMAKDATSGHLLWENDELDVSTFQVSNGVLIGSHVDWDSIDAHGNPEQQLVALSIENGEILWSFPLSIDDTDSHRSSRQISFEVLNDVVLLVYHSGTLRALDTTTGDPVWEVSFDPGTSEKIQMSSPNGEQWEETRYYAATAIWNDILLIVNGDGILMLFNPKTGELANSHAILEPQRGVFAINQLTISPLPTGVLLTRDIASPDGQKSETLMLDPLTGEVAWTHEFEGSLSISVAENGLVAMSSHIWHQNSWLLQIFDRHGYSTHQLIWFNAVTGDEILETERARSDYLQFAITDGRYACTRTDETEIVCFDRNGTRHIVQVPQSTGLPALVDGVLYIPTMNGLYRVELP